MIIENKLKKMIVIKAMDRPALNLFPGMNLVEDHEAYFKTKAAKGHMDTSLRLIPNQDATSSEKIQAKKSAEKNADLNKAKKPIQFQKKSLIENNINEVLNMKMEELERKMSMLKDGKNGKR